MLTELPHIKTLLGRLRMSWPLQSKLRLMRLASHTCTCSSPSGLVDHHVQGLLPGSHEDAEEEALLT